VLVEADVNRHDAIAILRRHRDASMARAIVHAALFGSMARGEERPDSDIDILIELAPDHALDVFQYAGLMDFVARMFPGHVDVVDREAIKPSIRGRMERDAIYAF
jgi:uncharacterized protein